MIYRLHLEEENALGCLSINCLKTDGISVCVVTVEGIDVGGGVIDTISACEYEYPGTDREDKETSNKPINSAEWWFDTASYCLGEIVSKVSHKTGIPVPETVADCLRHFRGDSFNPDKFEPVGGMIGAAEWQEEGRLF